MVSVKTVRRKIDFKGNCIPKLTYFLNYISKLIYFPLLS